MSLLLGLQKNILPRAVHDWYVLVPEDSLCDPAAVSDTNGIVDKSDRIQDVLSIARASSAFEVVHIPRRRKSVECICLRFGRIYLYRYIVCLLVENEIDKERNSVSRHHHQRCSCPLHWQSWHRDREKTSFWSSNSMCGYPQSFFGQTDVDKVQRHGIFDLFSDQSFAILAHEYRRMINMRMRTKKFNGPWFRITAMKLIFTIFWNRPFLTDAR